MIRTPGFAGGETFARAASRAAAGQEVAVLGIPYDLGTTNRPGARYGPRAIRTQSAYLGGGPPLRPWAADLTSEVRIADLGDVVVGVHPQASAELRDVTHARAAAALDAGAALLTLGGDHSVIYGPVRAAAERFGRLALIQLDAHQDTFDDAAEPAGPLRNHATIVSDLVKDGLVDPAVSTQVYLRAGTPHPHATLFEATYCEEAADMTPDALAERIRARAGDAPVYITIDIDAVDPAFAPGTGAPVPGGPSSLDVRRLLCALGRVDVVGCDVVEVNPLFDPAEVTALLAAALALDCVQLLARASRRRASRGAPTGRP